MLASRAFWLVAVAALAGALGYSLSVFREPSAPPPPTVAFVTAGDGEYWQMAVEGARAAAAAHGANLKEFTPDEAGGLEAQMQALSTLDTPGIGAVALCPIDPEEQLSIVNALAAGRPVVTFDSDCPSSTRLAYIGTSNYSAGLMVGTLVKQAIPQGGKVVVLVGSDKQDNLTERRGGFTRRIEESPNPAKDPVDPRFKVVGFLNDGGDAKRCEELLRETLEEHPDLACVVGMNARHVPTILEVLGDLDKLGAVKVVGFDTLDATLEGIEKGHVFATVAQDPYSYGYEAVNMLCGLCQADARALPVVGRGSIHISVEPVRRENLADFRQRMSKRGGDADAAK